MGDITATNITATGTLTAGSGAEQLTNAAGKIDGAKIQDGTIPGSALDGSQWKAWIDASDGWPHSTNPCSTLQTVTTESPFRDVRTLDFDATSNENASFQVGLPADYDGSALKFRLFWTATSGTSGSVVWSVSAASFANDEALGTAGTGTSGSAVDAFIAQKDMHIAEVTVTPTNANGGLLSLRLLRNAVSASDTFDADARLIGIEVAYA